MTDYENKNHQPPYPDMPQQDMPTKMKKNRNRYASTALMFGIFSMINYKSEFTFKNCQSVIEQNQFPMQPLKSFAKRKQIISCKRRQKIRK